MGKPLNCLPEARAAFSSNQYNYDVIKTASVLNKPRFCLNIFSIVRIKLSGSENKSIYFSISLSLSGRYNESYYTVRCQPLHNKKYYLNKTKKKLTI